MTVTLSSHHPSLIISIKLAATNARSGGPPDQGILGQGHLLLITGAKGIKKDYQALCSLGRKGTFPSPVL